MVQGEFDGTVVFGVGEPGETTLSTVLIVAGYIARYRADGTLTWVLDTGVMGGDTGSSVASVPDGSSLLVGDFGGSVTFGDGDANEATLTSAGNNDLYLARLNADGGF